MSATQQSPARTAPKSGPTPKRQRGVSGNPAKRGAAQDGNAARDSATATSPDKGRPTWLFLLLAGLITALTGAYTTAAVMAPVSVDSFALLTLLTVPALVTMVFVPEARSRGIYRWPVAWILGFTSMYPLPVLILAQSWVLIRFWLVEYDPALPPAFADRLPRRRAKTSD